MALPLLGWAFLVWTRRYKVNLGGNMGKDIDFILRYIKEEEFLIEQEEDLGEASNRLNKLNKIKEKYGLPMGAPKGTTTEFVDKNKTE